MKLKITVDGRVYEAEVEVSDPGQEGPSYYPPLHALVPAASPRASRSSRPGPRNATGDDAKVCRSPLAGTVTRIEAVVGQAIVVNAQLLALEAMKMETVITATFEGTVKAINAAVGDAVQQGQVLVEFE